MTSLTKKSFLIGLAVIVAAGVGITIFTKTSNTQQNTANESSDTTITQTESSQSEQEETVSNNQKIRIKITNGDRVLYGELDDTLAARDLASMLPITIDVEQYANTERIGYLSRKLSTDGEPAGIDPSVGDITYYAPWGNLALFYADFGYSSGLVKLGQITEGLSELKNLDGSTTFALDE